MQFFAPVVPLDIDMMKDGDGRPSGYARVAFATQAAAKEAMKKDREYMGSRYIELSVDPCKPTIASLLIMSLLSQWEHMTTSVRDMTPLSTTIHPTPTPIETILARHGRRWVRCMSNQAFRLM